MAEPDAAPRAKSWFDFTAIHPTRAIGLMCVGALIGAVLGIISLVETKDKGKIVGVPAEDVAIVNGAPIARSDFEAELQIKYKTDAAHATRAQKRDILNFLIDQELYVERGKALDVDWQDSDLRLALYSAVEGQVTADALTAEVDDAKLREYFNANRMHYISEGFLTLRDFVFPKTADGSKIVAALRAAKGSPAVAARFGGADSKRVQDEEFYFAAKIHLGDFLYAKAVALPTGAVSDPIVQPDGLHVLYIVNNRPPPPPAFESVKDVVLRDYNAAAAARLTKGENSFFLKRANILIAQDLR